MLWAFVPNLVLWPCGAMSHSPFHLVGALVRFFPRAPFLVTMAARCLELGSLSTLPFLFSTGGRPGPPYTVSCPQDSLPALWLWLHRVYGSMWENRDLNNTDSSKPSMNMGCLSTQTFFDLFSLMICDLCILILYILCQIHVQVFCFVILLKMMMIFRFQIQLFHS